MPRQTAHIELPSGERIRVYVQDAQLASAGQLHLSHLMSRSEWSDPTTEAAARDELFAATHETERRKPKPLARLRATEPLVAQVQVHDGKQDVAFTPVVLTQVHIGVNNVTLANLDADTASHVFLYGRTNPVDGSIDVTGADAILYPVSAQAMPAQTVACGALRTRQLIRAAAGERVCCNDHPGAQALADHPAPLVENGHGADDSHYLNALSIAFSIESNGRQHFLATHVGNRLLTAPTSPAQTIAASPDQWAYQVAYRAHVGVCPIQGASASARCRCVEAHAADYIDRAHALDQRLVSSWLGDKLRDVYSNITTGVKASVKKLLPSDETIATLKSLNTKAVSGARSVVGSQTAKQVVLSAVGNKGDASQAKLFATALLGDSGLDETAAGSALIENADKVTAALKSAWSKMRALPMNEAKEYAQGLRQQFDHEAVRGGLRAVLSQAAKAPELFEKYGPQLVSAGKRVVDASVKAAPAIISTGKQAVDLGGSALGAITKLVAK